jgi:hypothetical protein
MPANTSPIFTLVPRATVTRITTADGSRDGNSIPNSVVAFEAGSNGSRLDFVTFTGANVTGSASTAKVCRVFLTDTGSANPRLISEVVLPSVNPSATAIGTTSTITYTNGLIINSGQVVRVTMSTGADQVDVLSRGGDY